MRVRIDQIIPDPNQPRKTFNPETLSELKDSLNGIGLIQPITVRPYRDGKYMIIVGERRFTAAKQRGDEKIECIVRQDIDDKTTREMQLAENTQQEDIPPKELAQAFLSHRQSYHLTQQQLATIIGVQQRYVSQIESILEVTSKIQDYISHQELDWDSASRIASIKDRQRQEEIADTIVKQGFGQQMVKQVVPLAKAQPDRSITDILNDILIDKANVEEMARAEAVKMASDIPLETPEDKERAAKALLKEAKQQYKKSMTPEEIAAKQAKKKAKRQERQAKAKEQAQKLSIEDIEAIAEKAILTNPGRAYQLKESLDKQLNQGNRNEERRNQLEPLPMPEGKYRTIVIDPPWYIDKIPRIERLDQFDIDYPTMTIDEIMALPITELADENGCHIYLWTTHKHLHDALHILEAWGAEYQCLMTWVKNVGFTPFSWMYSTEHCLFARIGNLPLLKLGKRLDFEAKVREHSRKPDEFYSLVNEVSPEPRIDMFSREKREGFAQYGNELDRFRSKQEAVIEL